MQKMILCVVLWVSTLAFAKSEALLKVEGAQFRPLNLAVPAGLSQGSSQARSLASELTERLRTDLNLLGVFKIVNPNSYIADVAKQGFDPTHIKWADWTNVGAEGLVLTELQLDGDKLDVQMGVYQVGAGLSFKQIKYRLPITDIRRVAHRIADDVYTFFTGEKGFLSAQIASIKTGHDSMQLVVMDIDGANEKNVTTGKSRNMLPNFAPQGDVILLTNYANNNPDLCEVRPDGRGFRRLSTYPGMNTGGVISPDGKTIAVTLSKSGSQQIYLEDRSGKVIKQLTTQGDINISPTFSPDGKQIAFVSNRTGNPHVYVMNVDGSNQRRVTFKGTYNQQPRFSPDGRYVVMTSRDENNVFDIFAIEVSTMLQPNQRIIRVTQDQGRNEDPIFVNNRTLIFVSDRSGKPELYLASLDGKFQQRITNQGGYSSPTVAMR